MTDAEVDGPENDGGGDGLDDNCGRKFMEDCIALTAEGTDVNTNSIERLIKLWNDFRTGHSSGFQAATDKCFETLLISTSRIIFNLKYSKCVPSPPKDQLKRAISECGESFDPDGPQSKLCRGVSAIVDGPWVASKFTSAMGCEKKTDNVAAENLWDSEGRVMLETRLEYLGRIGKKATNQMCSILHILVMKIREALGDEVERIQSMANSPYKPYGYPSEKYRDYLGVYGMLCFQKNFNEEVLDEWDEWILLQTVSSMKENIAVDPVDGMFSKIVKWENVKKGTRFVVRKATWKALKSTTTTHLEELFKIWMEISSPEDQGSSEETCPVDEILIDLDKVNSSEHLYRLANMFAVSVGLPFANRLKFVELFLAAMKMDMSTIEKLKNSAKDESEVIGNLEKCLSLRFLELAKSFAESPRIAGGCLLTAFSLKPCNQIYNILFPDDIENIDITNDEDAAPFKDFMELSSISYDFETDYANSGDADLPPALLDDLRNLITNPQYKGFVGRNSRTTIQEKCRKLLESKSIAVIENRTLDHLELDYDKYKHLKPQYDPDDDGIEKGYREGEKFDNRRIYYRSNQVKRSINYAKALQRGRKVLPIRTRLPKEKVRLPKRNVQTEPSRKRKRLSEAPMIPYLMPNYALRYGPWYQPYGPTLGGYFDEFYQTHTDVTLSKTESTAGRNVNREKMQLKSVSIRTSKISRENPSEVAIPPRHDAIMPLYLPPNEGIPPYMTDPFGGYLIRFEHNLLRRTPNTQQQPQSSSCFTRSPKEPKNRKPDRPLPRAVNSSKEMLKIKKRPYPRPSRRKIGVKNEILAGVSQTEAISETGKSKQRSTPKVSKPEALVLQNTSVQEVLVPGPEPQNLPPRTRSPTPPPPPPPPPKPKPVMAGPFEILGGYTRDKSEIGMPVESPPILPEESISSASRNKPKQDEKMKDPARNKIVFQSGPFPYSSQGKNSSENLNSNAKLALVKQPPRNPATIAIKTYGVPKKKKLVIKTPCWGDIGTCKPQDESDAFNGQSVGGLDTCSSIPRASSSNNAVIERSLPDPVVVGTDLILPVQQVNPGSALQPSSKPTETSDRTIVCDFKTGTPSATELGTYNYEVPPLELTISDSSMDVGVTNIPCEEENPILSASPSNTQNLSRVVDESHPTELLDVKGSTVSRANSSPVEVSEKKEVKCSEEEEVGDNSNSEPLISETSNQARPVVSAAEDSNRVDCIRNAKPEERPNAKVQLPFLSKLSSLNLPGGKSNHSRAPSPLDAQPSSTSADSVFNSKVDESTIGSPMQINPPEGNTETDASITSAAIQNDVESTLVFIENRETFHEAPTSNVEHEDEIGRNISEEGNKCLEGPTLNGSAINVGKNLTRESSDLPANGANFGVIETSFNVSRCSENKIVHHSSNQNPIDVKRDCYIPDARPELHRSESTLNYPDNFADIESTTPFNRTEIDSEEIPDKAVERLWELPELQQLMNFNTEGPAAVDEVIPRTQPTSSSFENDTYKETVKKNTNVANISHIVERESSVDDRELTPITDCLIKELVGQDNVHHNNASIAKDHDYNNQSVTERESLVDAGNISVLPNTDKTHDFGTRLNGTEIENTRQDDEIVLLEENDPLDTSEMEPVPAEPPATLLDDKVLPRSLTPISELEKFYNDQLIQTGKRKRLYDDDDLPRVKISPSVLEVFVGTKNRARSLFTCTVRMGEKCANTLPPVKRSRRLKNKKTLPVKVAKEFLNSNKVTGDRIVSEESENSDIDISDEDIEILEEFAPSAGNNSLLECPMTDPLSEPLVSAVARKRTNGTTRPSRFPQLTSDLKVQRSRLTDAIPLTNISSGLVESELMHQRLTPQQAITNLENSHCAGDIPPQDPLFMGEDDDYLVATDELNVYRNPSVGSIEGSEDMAQDSHTFQLEAYDEVNNYPVSNCLQSSNGQYTSTSSNEDDDIQIIIEKPVGPVFRDPAMNCRTEHLSATPNNGIKSSRSSNFNIRPRRFTTVQSEINSAVSFIPSERLQLEETLPISNDYCHASQNPLPGGSILPDKSDDSNSADESHIQEQSSNMFIIPDTQSDNVVCDTDLPPQQEPSLEEEDPSVSLLQSLPGDTCNQIEESVPIDGVSTELDSLEDGATEPKHVQHTKHQEEGLVEEDLEDTGQVDIISDERREHYKDLNQHEDEKNSDTNNLQQDTIKPDTVEITANCSDEYENSDALEISCSNVDLEGPEKSVAVAIPSVSPDKTNCVVHIPEGRSPADEAFPSVRVSAEALDIEVEMNLTSCATEEVEIVSTPVTFSLNDSDSMQRKKLETNRMVEFVEADKGDIRHKTDSTAKTATEDCVGTNSVMLKVCQHGETESQNDLQLEDLVPADMETNALNDSKFLTDDDGVASDISMESSTGTDGGTMPDLSPEMDEMCVRFYASDDEPPDLMRYDQFV